MGQQPAAWRGAGGHEQPRCSVVVMESSWAGGIHKDHGAQLLTRERQVSGDGGEQRAPQCKLTELLMSFSLTCMYTIEFTDSSCSSHYQLFRVRERLSCCLWGMDMWRLSCKGEVLMHTSALLHKRAWHCTLEMSPMDQLPLVIQVLPVLPPAEAGGHLTALRDVV